MRVCRFVLLWCFLGLLPGTFRPICLPAAERLRTGTLSATPPCREGGGQESSVARRTRDVTGEIVLPSAAPSREFDLVDLESVIPGLLTDVRYATAANFTGQVVYPSARVFLRRPAAERLASVTAFLAWHHGLRVKVFDGYRPLSVQKRFWEILPDDRYVANPATGSKHNRGAAVDLTLVGPDGADLDMGTAFDDFSARAGHGFRDLPTRVLANRRLLRSVMSAFGFEPLASEWWHYDLRGWKQFPVEDVPLP